MADFFCVFEVSSRSQIAVFEAGGNGLADPQQSDFFRLQLSVGCTFTVVFLFWAKFSLLNSHWTRFLPFTQHDIFEFLHPRLIWGGFWNKEKHRKCTIYATRLCAVIWITFYNWSRKLFVLFLLMGNSISQILVFKRIDFPSKSIRNLN